MCLVSSRRVGGAHSSSAATTAISPEGTGSITAMALHHLLMAHIFILGMPLEAILCLMMRSASLAMSCVTLS